VIIITLVTVVYKKLIRTPNTGGFKNTYGSVLEGTKYKTEEPSLNVLGYPLIFFGRRIIFVVSVLFLGHFLYGQLVIQMVI
jgi:hypothetical protein